MTIEQMLLRNDPLFVGFERIFDRMNAGNKVANIQQKYPPYNIVREDENTYLIELAVAGFGEKDLDIEIHDSVLTIRGNVTEYSDTADYIFKGIAARNFERKFTLADTVEVKELALSQGMLTIRLVNIIPDEKKPRKLFIGVDKPPEKQLLVE
jgi:molecular chaperone IbpA